MKKAERLLDLITYFLNLGRPVTFEEIQQQFPEDYAESSQESASRKFERDKAEILQLGLPLRYVEDQDSERAGYWIERDNYALPAIPLDPEELAVLWLAASAVLDMQNSPFAPELSRALNKIVFATGQQIGIRRSGERLLKQQRRQISTCPRGKELLQDLRQAILERKLVVVSYYSPWKDESTLRTVEPYGLACLRGDWFLVGYCRLRHDIRVFNVDRISTLEVNRKKQKTPDFEVASDFRINDHLAKHPWNIPVHEPVEAVIRIEPQVAETVKAELGLCEHEVRSDGPSRILVIEVSNMDGLLPAILWYRDKARILSPPELVGKAVSAWKRISLQEP